ncbi:pyruvate dehydrogenase complex dihydrolipoamide acetyltransferase [Blastococcus jejuensis]|uniref:Dihydrolipoamide acetyltransferase component of pyruvate dehydrogenase complex n=1 Tax=Blastococcus jejuensis TaxID=351224 RepID=A0ABP6NT82_9ACTN
MTVARLMRMPEVAAGGTSAVLHEWSVAERAEFGAADVLATVETDKAVVDVEADQPGVVVKLLVPSGATVEVGAPIAVLGDPGETVGDVDSVLAALGVADAAATAPDPEGAPDQPASPDVPAALVPETVAASGLTAAPPSSNGHGRIFASPLARRLAREAQLPLQGIIGTGPGGRIVRRDIEAAVVARPAEAPLAAPAATFPGDASYTDVPHTPMRRAIARRLTESKQTVPHFTLRATIRVDALLALRTELAGIGTKVSVTDLLVKAAGRAHTAVPGMNAIWTPEATRAFTSVDVGVAVSTGTGLLTPVVRGVDRLSVGAISATVGDLVERARSGRLRQDELEGGSLTLTNLGMYGTEEFAAIINPPQSAILAVGAARQEPVVVDGSLAVASVLRVTLSADHRVIDGALAAQWMAAFVAAVEQPLQLLV